jgi:hypothetical protein
MERQYTTLSMEEECEYILQPESIPDFKVLKGKYTNMSQDTEPVYFEPKYKTKLYIDHNLRFLLFRSSLKLFSTQWFQYILFKFRELLLSAEECVTFG